MKTIVNKLRVVSFVTAAIVALPALAAAPAESPDLIAKGKAAFSVNCATCHGEQMDGNGPAGKYMNPKPRNLVTEKLKAGDTKEKIFDTISKGLPGTSMSAFGHVAENDRWGMVYYILSLRNKK